MNRIIKFYKEHKKTCLMVFAVLLIFVVFSVTSALRVSDMRNHVQIEENANQNIENTNTEQGDGSVELSEQQSSLIENYTQTERDLVNILKASMWSAEGSKYTLRFYDNYYIDVSNGSSTQHTYAISHIEKASSTSANTTSTNFVLLTDTGTHVVKYNTATGTSANNSIYNIAALSSIDAFSKNNTTYERAESVQSVVVSGLNDEVLTLLKTDGSKLKQTISDYCSLYYPVVTEVTWDKTISFDYDKQIAVLYFNMGDKNTKRLLLTYNMQTDTYSIS